MNTNQINNPLWTAMITPLTASGEPDLSSMEQLLREQEQAGNGILILGSTGEALNLDESERKQIVELTMSLDLAVPVMVGVGGHHLPGIISWLSWLETKKVDAYLMVTPLYAKPGPEGQFHWFKTLMDSASRPVMLYNIPSRTGIALHLDTVRRLSSHRNFWAIKEAGGTVSGFREYVSAAGSGVVYSGDDALLPDYVSHGVAGVVSVAGNVWPEAARRYSELALSGELTDKELAFWKKACQSLFIASNPVPAKAVLCTEGRIRTPEVKMPLHKNDMTGIDRVLRISQQVTAWNRKRSQSGVTAGC